MQITNFFQRYARASIVHRSGGIVVAALIAIFSLPTTVFAQSAFCALGGECACKPDVLPFPISDLKAPPGGGQLPISLEGDEVDSIGDQQVILTGNAELMQGRQRISADQLKYFRDTDEVEGSGNISMRTVTGDMLEAGYLRVQIPTQIGEAKGANYKIAKRKRITRRTKSVEISARGTAEQVYLEGADVVRLENVTYTTCAENNDDVWLRASDLRIDQGTGKGLAKNLRVRFKNVPIFYFPLLSFPINDDRKTGFLFPSFGSATDSGFIFGVPWYWNIRPNVDATIKPSIYTGRGYQIAGEFRYLTENSDGSFYGEFLPGDDQFDGNDRHMFSFNHDQQFGNSWSAGINYNDVSDTFYFNDFRNDISYFSAVYVPRSGVIRYSSEWFSISAVAHDYQPVDDTVGPDRQPYERLPEISFSAYLPDGPGPLRFGFSGSAVDYRQDVLVEGKRLDITPSLELDLENTWGFFKPGVAWRYTNYSLNNVAEGVDGSPSRSVPIITADTGITLERRASWFGETAIHSLSPRIFYAYIPTVDQKDIPRFNTYRVAGNSFSDLYRANRYWGADRVGNTNQVTVGLTTRISGVESGRRYLKASFGQTFYFEDRLDENDNPTLDQDKSDFIGELWTSLGDHISAYGYALYDHENKNIRQGKVDLSLSMGPRRVLSVGYRYTRRSIDQLTAQLRWQLTERWQLFGTERYALDRKENLETTLGLEFNGCCWRFSIYGQRRVEPNRNRDDMIDPENATKTRNAIIAEFELTGLAKVRAGL